MPSRVDRKKPLRARIAERAYYEWLREGMIHGRDVSHWLRAEWEESRDFIISIHARAASPNKRHAP